MHFNKVNKTKAFYCFQPGNSTDRALAPVDARSIQGFQDVSSTSFTEQTVRDNVKTTQRQMKGKQE